MVDHDLVANAAHRGAQLKSRLEEICRGNRIVGDVRGLGLLLAVEVVRDKDTREQLPLELQAPALFQRIAMSRGLATYCRRTSGGAYGDWLMITPPLIVTEAQVEEIATGLDAALAEFEDTIAKADY